jgi:S1-C subfamily serine protease
MFGFIFLSAVDYIQIKNLEAQWEKIRQRGLKYGKTYGIKSGSGFYIAPGYILTNQHVVNDCINISIRGAVSPYAATLIAFDSDIDLALLKTDINSPRIANFRNNEGLSQGSKIVVIGYPLKHSDSGLYLLKDGTITVMKDPVTLINTIEEIEFSNIVDNGNSGGPLIDESGNVIGVITRKKSFHYNEYEPPFKIHGIAIGLSLIDQFLKKYNIQYLTNSSYFLLNNFQIESQAKDYIVNIHCIINKNTSTSSN